MAYVVGVIILVVVLLVSIALHEVGHMVPARKFGVRINQYMVGFGPTIFSRKRGETEYGIKAIPLGGYVRLMGMYPPAGAVGDPPADGGWATRLAADAREASAEEIPDGEDHRAFYHLSTPKKLVVMLGGPVMNLVIAAVLLAIAYVGIGMPAASTTVASVEQCVLPATASADAPCTAADPPAPGAAAGIRAGDRVVSFGGTAITSWDQLSTLIRGAGGRSVTMVVERGGQDVTLQVTPAVAQRPVLDANGLPVTAADGTPQTAPAGYLGVVAGEVTQRASLASIPGLVGDNTWATMKVVGTLPVQAYQVLHETLTGEARGGSSIVGIVGVGRFAGDIASASGTGIGWGLKAAGLLEILAALNLSLFVFNLIPLPPLDGGHVAAALWEGAKRQAARLRRLPKPRVADTARLVPLAYTVFAVLGVLGAMLIWADIVNPVAIG
ncbi:MAG: site-2 protease family protein [Micrococcales bacterium]|nr:site-2 protease family protein [Micrococcales bacterium]